MSLIILESKELYCNVLLSFPGQIWALHKYSERMSKWVSERMTVIRTLMLCTVLRCILINFTVVYCIAKTNQSKSSFVPWCWVFSPKFKGQKVWTIFVKLNKNRHRLNENILWDGLKQYLIVCATVLWYLTLVVPNIFQGCTLTKSDTVTVPGLNFSYFHPVSYVFHRREEFFAFSRRVATIFSL